MSRIKIKNFGPIKSGFSENHGWMEIKKVTTFIGNQGSGKSTIAKLISTLLWIEKVLTRGNFDEKEFTAPNFKNKYCRYHRITSYFLKGKTEIAYEGDSYKFTYTKDERFLIEKNEKGSETYSLPQIMYVPAERNFISMVEKPNLISKLPLSLLTFLTEYDNAKEKVKGQFTLPINNAVLTYRKQNDTISVKGDGYQLKLMDASSGFQSLVPLYLVSKYLSESVKEQKDKTNQINQMSSDDTKRFEERVKSIWDNDKLTDAQQRSALSVLSAHFNKSAFVNIVEEPEQNLFPSSQLAIMQSLLAFNNSIEANKLIITTHSPYLINGLTIAIKAGILNSNFESRKDLRKELNSVYPLDSILDPKDVAIYELSEIDGTVNLLKNYEGLPSDENFLNNMLDEGNNLFAALLEIQQKL